MPRSDTTRSTVLDRALATSRTIAMTGPLAPLDADRIRERLAPALTPTSRLTVVPDPASTSWTHDVSPHKDSECNRGNSLGKSNC